jgi:hypothetical protein
MSLCDRARGRVFFVLAIFILGLTSSAVLAQDEVVPKIDVFAGYSWYNPGLRVNGTNLDSDPKGFAGAITYNFNKWVGLTVDGAGHFGSDSNSRGSNQAGTIMFGPRLIWRQEHFQPFVHTMLGVQTITLDSAFAPAPGVYNDWGIGTMLGGGFDIPVNRRFSVRLLEANYVWAHHNFFPRVANRNSNPSGAISALA